MLTISEIVNKSPLSPDEDKLLFYSAAAVSMLGMITTIVWKAYKLCGGRKNASAASGAYIVKHGFTEVVPFVVVDPIKKVEVVKVVEQSEHEITQL